MILYNVFVFGLACHLSMVHEGSALNTLLVWKNNCVSMGKYIEGGDADRHERENKRVLIVLLYLKVIKYLGEKWITL